MGDVPRPQRPALVRYARVLARAAHLRAEDGGKLDHKALARIVGLDVTVLAVWRQRMVDAGLVAQSGDERDRRYRVLMGAAATLDDELNRIMAVSAAEEGEHAAR